MFRCGWIFLVFLYGMTVSAQTTSDATEQGRTPKKLFQVNVDLVQLDVTVTDSKGRPVTDLTPEDFTVIQDAKPREITSFSLVHVKEPAGTGKPNYKQVRKESDDLPAPTPSAEVQMSQVRRIIALVVDDLGMSFEGIYYTSQAVKKWVDEEMQPGDLVALIRTGVGVGTLQQFTTDKRLLHTAIDNITYNTYNRMDAGYAIQAIETDTGATDTGATDTETTTETDANEEYARAVNEESSRQGILASLKSIEYVLDSLRNLPGRKSLILFSENLPQNLSQSDPQSVGDLSQDHSVEDTILQLVKEANKTAVVIHAIDTRGLKSDAGDDSAQDGMVTLSKGTGGLFEKNRNDIDGALVEAVRDGDVYYLLGYQPDEEMAAEMRAGQSKFHSIKVSVNRPGLTVRTRKDFMGRPEPPPEPRTYQERVDRALYSPFASGALPVQLTALFSKTREGKSVIHSLVHFDINELNFSEEPDGWRKSEFEIAYALFDIHGQQLDFAARKMSLTVKGETLKEMRKNGVVIRSSMPAKLSGSFQLRVVVSDTGSGLTGSAMQYIEIPDTSKGGLALSGIALASKQFQPEDIGEGQREPVIEGSMNGTPAVRIFEAGETITWAYQVLNMKTGADKKARLQTYFRLFNGGKVIYVSEPAEIVREPEGQSRRLVGIGQMQLKRIAPGGYDLQVVVKDRLAKKSSRIAVQSIHFEVRNPKVAAAH